MPLVLVCWKSLEITARPKMLRSAYCIILEGMKKAGVPMEMKTHEVHEKSRN